MNKLSTAKRAQIVGMLVEGMSLRATSRLADVSINTVTKLLVDVGSACAEYQDKTLRNLNSKRIQCDEIWSFVYAKDKNAAPEMKAAGNAGDVWTWTAIDADSKLMVSWMVGRRDIAAAKEFIGDVASRLANRVQISTDGHRPYLTAIEATFGEQIDYGRLVKFYNGAGDFVKADKLPAIGNPDMKHLSTSYVERANLTMRMGMRRFTRSTNAFSKKVENHAHAIALHFMFYNFGRVHKTLRVTPAMEAGIADHVWSLEEIARIGT